MDLTQWTSISEIAASVAIIASLIFVGMQVHQNTRAVRSSTHQSLLDYQRDISTLIITNPEVAALVEKGKQTPGALSELERTQFFEYALVLFSAYEAAYLNRRAGLMDTAHFDAYEGSFRDMAATPGYVACFEANKDAFIDPFKGYFESKIEKT